MSSRNENASAPVHDARRISMSQGFGVSTCCLRREGIGGPAPVVALLVVTTGHGDDSSAWGYTLWRSQVAIHHPEGGVEFGALPGGQVGDADFEGTGRAARPGAAATVRRGAIEVPLGFHGARCVCHHAYPDAPQVPVSLPFCHRRIIEWAHLPCVCRPGAGLIRLGYARRVTAGDTQASRRVGFSDLAGRWEDGPFGVSGGVRPESAVGHPRARV
jgi:hypothetical protein